MGTHSRLHKHTDWKKKFRGKNRFHNFAGHGTFFLFLVAWEIGWQHCADCFPNFVFSPLACPLLSVLFPFNWRTWVRQTGRAAFAVNGFIHNYRHRQEAARGGRGKRGEGRSIFCQSAGFEAERSHVWAALRWLWGTWGHWCWWPRQWITSSFFCVCGSGRPIGRRPGITVASVSFCVGHACETGRRYSSDCVWNSGQSAA